ncbi:MAG: prepilin-type N-terminal cleavage/methylation domain-containing protein [Bacteroidota bacterium]
MRNVITYHDKGSPPAPRTPHLKGFTLLEMLLALALTSAVLTLGFFTFRTFLQFQIRYEQKVNATYDMALIHHQVQQDLRKAAQLQLQGGNVLLFDAKQELLIRYQSEDSMLLRFVDQRVDTLFGKGTLSIHFNQQSLIWTDLITGENIFPLPKRARP